MAMKLLRCLLIGICWLPASAATQEATPAVDPPVVEPPVDPGEQFRTHFAAGEFAAALPFAEERVRRLESGGGEGNELASAYGDLAATQLRLDDLAGSEASGRRALQLTEDSYGISTPRLIAPLGGLAATLAAMDRHAQAAELLRRAIAVSRRNEGLFNLGQLPLIDRLVASLELLDDSAAVLEERQYALKVAESNFGANDLRTLPAVTNLADFYESRSEYRFARTIYEHMHAIGLQEGTTANPITVTALLGIARNHRLQFTRNPRSLIVQQFYKDPVTGNSVPIMVLEPYQGPMLNRQGRKALEDALEMLRATDNPPPRLLAATLIETGDWDVALGHFEKALPLYTEAWTLHATQLADEPNPLAEPRLVYYRAPTGSDRDEKTVMEPMVTKTARFRLTVDKTGAVQGPKLEQNDLSELQADYLRRSLEDSHYSPRFENGAPVETTDVLFVGEWRLLKSAAKPPSTAAPVAPQQRTNP